MNERTQTPPLDTARTSENPEGESHADGHAKKGAARQRTCYQCGKVFARGKPGTASQDYWVYAQGALCTNRPDCRQRSLAKELGKMLYSKHPQEQLIVQMDVRPKNWKAVGWEPINTPVMRVLAAIEYFSLCYPVCISYAVQIDEEGEPLKDKGMLVRHTHRSLAAALGIDQGQVTRAIEHLKCRKVVTQDEDGGIRIAPHPAPLTEAEREEVRRSSYDNLSDVSIASESGILKDLRALNFIPKRDLLYVVELLGSVPPDVSTGIKKKLLDASTRLNERIFDARTEAKTAVADVTSELLSLLSRIREEGENSEPPASSSYQESAPAQNPPLDDDGHTPIDEQYAADPSARRAFAKLNRPRPDVDPEIRATYATVRKALTNYALADDDAVGQLIRACRKNAPDCTAIEIALAIEARGASALKAGNPIGFLITAAPKLLSGDSLLELRQAAAARQEKEKRAQEVRDMQNRRHAQDILQDPEASHEDTTWAREVLGIAVRAAGEEPPA